MADPKSSDPIAREDRRVFGAPRWSARRASLDPLQLQEWTPNSRYGGHAFGFMDPKDLKSRDTQFSQNSWPRRSSNPAVDQGIFALSSTSAPDDPPIYLHYAAAPALGKEQKDPTHTANYGVKLQEKLRSVGVECELVYPGAPDVTHAKALGLSHRQAQGSGAEESESVNQRPAGDLYRLVVSDLSFRGADALICERETKNQEMFSSVV